ncbi:MAG: dihydroorotate dehydrogenase electron transfer subunit [Candidatus Omnitrophota bacterium]|nr:MAG: dihydroorotate dehydrogenase electron transfer subunit [Candidatus Omnitrophota bacterium]
MKAKQLKVKVKDIKKVNDNIFLLSISSAYLASQSRPGQFLHFKIHSTILRRPLSVHRVKGKEAHVLFKIRGKGTEILSRYKKGEILDVIGPLGNGFFLKKAAAMETTNILVAGGIGVAPLMFLAEKLRGEKLVLLGAKTKKEIVCELEFRRVGCKVSVATEDGSKGIKGTATELLRKTLMGSEAGKINIYACGPQEMLSQINNVIDSHPVLECQVSFEQFMGCGLGVCCGCTIETKHGYKKVCKDGPVFNIKDVW